MTPLKTSLAVLLAVSTAAPAAAQGAPAAAMAEEPGCHAYLVYPPAAPSVSADRSLSCEAQDVPLQQRAAGPEAALQEHASGPVDASLAAVNVP